MDAAVIGDWIAGAGVCVAGIASWFAWRSWRGTQTIDTRDLQPRIYLEFPSGIAPDGSGKLKVRLRNGGGDAQWHRVIVHAGDTVFFSGAHATNHGEIREETLQPLYQPGTSTLSPKVKIQIACDIEGKWWDLLKHKRLGNGVQEWLRDQSTALGFPQPFQLSPAETNSTP
jgi:hypothetical protein